MSGLGDSPPSWPQPPISALGRRRPPSPLLSPPVLIVLFPILALFLLFFAVPSLVSFSSHVLRPVTVKKSWDSLNVFLVLFAILCGIFARGSDDEAPVPGEGEKSAARLASADKVGETTLRRWFESGDDKMFGYNEPAMGSPGGGIGRLRSSSSSYPDLKQDSPWETGDDRFRFFDDFEVSKYSSSSTQFDGVVPLRRWRSAIDDDDIKVIPVDTFVLRTPPSPASPPPPPAAKSPAPPPPPPPPVRHAYEAVARRSTGRRASDGAESAKIGKAPPAPPPPPPRPPPTPPTEYRYAKIERRKSNTAKEIKMVLASVLSNQRKRKKKQSTRTLNNDAAHPLAPETTSHSTAQPPPPPPPPPPPLASSVFQSLFRKSSKSKRIHSVPAPPPPPPPPEPRRRRTLASAPKPPLPAKPAVHQPSSGSRSPLIPMPPPPPPPPPPFRAPESKSVASGDFVRIRCARSSRCSSPELEDSDVASSPSHERTTTDGRDHSGCGASGGPGMFCPSPDVNVKADTFIAMLKDGWRLEKINSIREKQSVGGPTPPPT